jgi:hypothetical protein
MTEAWQLFRQGAVAEAAATHPPDPTPAHERISATVQPRRNTQVWVLAGGIRSPQRLTFRLFIRPNFWLSI